MLAGLACYVNALRKEEIPIHLIEYAIELGLENDNNNIKIEKIDLNNMSKEETKATIAKELDKIFN